MQKSRGLRRNDRRIIIHFDYDCFYASVVENENPALKSVPLAIQQKQIVVTCNYEARRRGLRKLQLITDAKKVCPDVVIILGEDLTRFRDASKELYNFLRQSIWSGRAERLGFDEVWLDCTDMIDYNMELLNRNDLQHSFFCLNKDDPTVGFEYDASTIFGPTFPPISASKTETATPGDEQLHVRLCLGSHLAKYVRHGLELEKGYTSTVGIATNKILSKLVGNVNKPKNQTTITPPYDSLGQIDSNVTQFLDPHDIGKIPGIGFKIAHKIRSHVLGRAPDFDEGLIWGGTRELVTVLDVRSHAGMGPELLESILGGPGSPKGIGGKVWELIHGVDDSEVGLTKRVPSQISQEDSYMKYLRTFEQVKEQLSLLSDRLIRRMRMDLCEEDEEDDDDATKGSHPRSRWMAHPRTLRLSTRPCPPPGPDGTRARTFQRISRSGPMPNFVFNLNEPPVVLAERLVEETLIPMFRKLHHDTNGWNLSLINIAATNMVETAAETKDSEGRDIGKMFRHQDEVLRNFKVTVESDTIKDLPSPLPEASSVECSRTGVEGSGANLPLVDVDGAEEWDSEDSDRPLVERCEYCKACVPVFALAAHHRYHELSN